MSHKTPKRAKPILCAGNTAFNPDEYLQDTSRQAQVADHLSKNDLYHAIVTAFGLPEQDTYTYHAITSVTLAQVQHVVSLGGANDLHAWYRAKDDTPLDPPPPADIEAYISLFDPSTQTTSALKTMQSNAKKGSLRAQSAAHLTAQRFLHPSRAAHLSIPRCKKTPPNPYFDFWAWSCRTLQWCGPCPEPSDRRPATSHHVLPVLMHHFGCATPSHEALELLRLVAAGRPLVDMGSGNGYWSYMLRRYGLGPVYPVDNMQSAWRVTWVPDTVVADGPRWLAARHGGRDMVLLLVYPVVGADGQGAFIRDLLAVYRGDTLAVVGTQNRNGYTGFRDMTMDEYMEAHQKEWTKVVQVALPSFPGKDEALYIFQRGDRAPAPHAVTHTAAIPRSGEDAQTRREREH
ncbi:hypothetical protein ACRALDRAFT_1079849 [Sodiomyces alcalophilus JCM 7366]|uniref:uncharacterized protein n=1 Tax=Sodiomyces alcalophilus JCM 7366 TaxID=591952 RepID=UPI0039B60C84